MSADVALVGQHPEWGEGPWSREPDGLSWTTAAGLPGLILRSDFTGALCGYVGLPAGHPWAHHPFGKIGVEIHGGGLSYGNDDPPDPTLKAEGAVWYVGFDCGRGYDYLPALYATLKAVPVALPGFGDRVDSLFGVSVDDYRELPYVRGEVESLADQAWWAIVGEPENERNEMNERIGEGVE